MNRKLEDAMVRLAFGDVTPDESAALEREAQHDPEAARALASYRRMREGLKDLHEVPEDQLSKERLRHAILSQGLRPKPVPSGRSWLWMPAAAATLAFGMILMRGGTNSPEVSIVGPAGGSVATNSAPKIDFAAGAGSSLAATQNSSTVAVNSVADKSVTDNDGFARRRTHRVKNRRTGQTVDNQYWAERVLRPEDDSAADKIATNTLDKGGPENTLVSTESAPLIIIDSQKDGATGAQKATEVPSASNVITSG